MHNQVKPNFFIVGAAKSATTSIYHYLLQHPDVFFPTVKEPKYFSSKYINFPQCGPGDIEYTDNYTYKDLNKYLDLYKNAEGFKVIGDASVDNLYYYQTATDIKHFTPDAKVLIILRNPIERAFSHYSHFVRDGRENESFENAICLESERIQNQFEFGWHYINIGFYYNQVKCYLDTFGKENVLVLFFEDVEFNASHQIEIICNFLKIDPSPLKNIKFVKYNTSGKSKSTVVNKLLFGHFKIKEWLKKIIPIENLANIKARVNSLNTVALPLQDSKTYSKLQEAYKKDILKLEELLHTNLDKWK